MNKAVSFLAIDKSIALNLFGRGWQSIAGIITLLAIGHYLSLVEQALYFTFLSVLGLQVFFELGLGYVILQFASHQLAHLTSNEEGLLEGDFLVKNRLSFYFRYTLNWGAIVALLTMSIIFIGGWYFISSRLGINAVDVGWQAPWILICVFSSILAFVNLIFCYLEGCGFVKEIASIRVMQNILASMAMWVLLELDGHLYSLSLMLAMSAVVGILYLFLYKRKFIFDIYRSYRADIKIKWIEELWPMQWRIAISWISGYLAFQLITPIVFAYKSPQVAAQIGMSMAVTMAIMSFPIAWINTKANKFGGMVSRREYINLDKDFYMAMRSSLLLLVLIITIIGATNYFMHKYNSIYAIRFLEPGPFLILILSAVVNYASYGLGFYLRSHKKEPLMINSMIGATISIGGLYICAKYFGVYEIVSSYLAVSIILFALTLMKFIENRRAWHV